LKVGGLEILLTSERMQMLDKNIFRAGGIEPDDKSILVVKSMQHFRAAFELGSEEIIVTDAGGLCTPDVTSRIYNNIRRPVYPLDMESGRVST
jgi:microcystin degradation protein MlrC